jgi:GH18 family chitinase
MFQKTALGSSVLAVLVSWFFFFPSSLVLAQQITVGYYAAWKSSILPFNEVKYSHLTHINVAFAYPLSNASLAFLGDGIPFPQLVSSAHAVGTKVLISVGGAANSNYFAAATSIAELRGKLIENLVSFLQSTGYDGVDLDWETPTNSTETAQATTLVQEMRNRFNQVNSSWLITMAVPPTDYGGQHFDFPNLLASVDWFNVMCYDFYGSWSSYAGHDAPLYQTPADPTRAGSDSSAVVYMVSRGVPKSKFVLGIPFYGVQFYARGLYQRLTNSATSNPLYADVLNDLATGWVYHWDDVAKVPYLTNADSTQFITFEDTNSVKLKVAFSVHQGLAGVMIWEISQDLVSNGSQPLLEAMDNIRRKLTAVASQNLVVSQFQLFDNYPNPFNSETVIRFSLPKPSHVSLAVFDILGREAGILLDEDRPVGVGFARFDASAFRLASGVYFYRLDADGLSQTKKVILMR